MLKVCLNGWFWSAIFHARDKPITEVMDYSCAFTIVMTLLFCILVRIFYKNYKIILVIICAYISILFTHLSYLWSGKINYGYNMKLNIFFGKFFLSFIHSFISLVFSHFYFLSIGLVTFTVTLIWWYRNSAKLPHAYLIGWFNILTVLVTLLEIADFPPLLWTFDAHSLWHASTAPLTYFLYRLVVLLISFLYFTPFIKYLFIYFQIYDIRLPLLEKKIQPGNN